MADLLPHLVASAVAIAISPAPVLAVLAMLGSRQGLRNALAFGIGWAGAIAGVGAVLVATVGPDSDDAGLSDAVDAWVRPVLGIGFLAAGIVKLVRTPGPPERSLLGRSLDRIDTMSWTVAMLVGVFIVLLNPKDMPLTLSGATEIVAADVSVGASLIAVAIFTVVASSTVTLPVLVYAAMPNRSANAIASGRVWLTRNERSVTVAVLLGLGVWWTVDGVLAALG